MSKAEVLEALRGLTLEEIVEVIEFASRLLRQAILPTPKLSLIQAAEQMAPFYAEGSELTQWTDEDPEDFHEYPNNA